MIGKPNDRGWWTVKEIAAARLPGFPPSEAGVARLVRQERWNAYPGLARRCEGTSEWEYSPSLFFDALNGWARDQACSALLLTAWEDASPEARRRFGAEHGDQIRAVLASSDDEAPNDRPRPRVVDRGRDRRGGPAGVAPDGKRQPQPRSAEREALARPAPA